MHAKTMTELRHAYYLRNRVHIFVMIGGTLLLVKGILMGFMRPELFRESWYMLSMVIYLIALAIAPLLLIKQTKPIKDVLELHPTEEIPEIYYQSRKKLFFYEHFTNILFTIIIILMVLKRFYKQLYNFISVFMIDKTIL